MTEDQLATVNLASHLVDKPQDVMQNVDACVEETAKDTAGKNEMDDQLFGMRKVKLATYSGKKRDELVRIVCRATRLDRTELDKLSKSDWNDIHAWVEIERPEVLSKVFPEHHSRLAMDGVIDRVKLYLRYTLEEMSEDAEQPKSKAALARYLKKIRPEVVAA